MSAMIENPYVGPRSFGESDSGRFYGRELEARNIVNLIIANRTLLLHSPSGAGKSSLLNAQILPALTREGFEVWPVSRASFTPGLLVDIKSIENIFIFGVIVNWESERETDPKLIQMTLPDYIKTKEPLLDSYGDPMSRILVLDQLEELFTTFPERWQDRENFFEQLGQALKSDPSLRFIFSMREEYLARIDTYAHLLPGGLRTRFLLERMRPENAIRALVGPIEQTDKRFAPGVAEKFIEQLRTIRGENGPIIGEFIEPVQLQVTAQQLWSNLPPDVTTITEDELVKFGDFDQSLVKFYENSIRHVTAQVDIEERQIREWFANELITVAGTPGIVYQGEYETAGLPNEAIRLLNAAYLIRPQFRGGSTWYELAHDRLIGPIQQSNERWWLDHPAAAPSFDQPTPEHVQPSNKFNLLLLGFVIGFIAGILITLLALTILG